MKISWLVRLTLHCLSMFPFHYSPFVHFIGSHTALHDFTFASRGLIDHTANGEEIMNKEGIQCDDC